MARNAAYVFTMMVVFTAAATFIEFPCSALAQRGPAATADGASSAASAPISDEPKELIALDLWVITLDLPKAKAADDLSAALAQRARELTNVIGAKEDVRLLVGKLTVAGLLRRSQEFHMLAANGQAAINQSRATIPMIHSSSMMFSTRGAEQRMGRTNATTPTDVGTIITLSPRLLTNGLLQVEVKYEASEIRKTVPPIVISEMAGTEPVVADQVVVQRINTSVQFKNGTAIVVQRDTTAEPGNDAVGIRTQLVVLSASVMSTNEQ